MTQITPTFASTSPLRREAAQVSALFHGHIVASSTDVITVETPGGHTWMVWRRNLAEVAPMLFQEKTR